MTDSVIRLAGAGKRFIKYADEPMLLNTLRSLHKRAKREALWAVRHVDLDVRHGESVGVLGRNGSGKSTMLQMIAGVTSPSEGSVTVCGQVAPLVQVGVGFHPELTGRENVYVNGTILGMTREEIDERLPAIHAFSELDTFLDTPVKFYSSGMYVRLGFSVAVAAAPDVLLVDEVLAVGDIAFQAKCYARMVEIRESGTTIVVVSHNVNQIRQLCDRTVVMNGGRIIFDGDTSEAIAIYFETVGTRVAETESGEITLLDEAQARVELDMLDEEGRPTRDVVSGQTVRLVLDAQIRDTLDPTNFGMVVSSAAGTHVYTEVFQHAGMGARPGERLRCDFTLRAALTSGIYSVDAGLVKKGTGEVLAWSRPLSFHVTGRPFVLGVADMGATVSDVRVEAAADKPATGSAR